MMKLNLKTYIVLGVVFFLSMISSFVSPTTEFFKGLIATPGAVALLGVLYQLIRDSAEFERKQFLQKDQQLFNLGATSHMSHIAFDKHVEFCEKYMFEVHQTVDTLFSEGPTERAIEHSKTLFELNKKYAAWIPKTIALELQTFEKALNKMAREEHLIKVLNNSSSQTEERKAKRNEAIEKSYQIFEELMNLEKINEDDGDKSTAIAIENIKEKIRSILGINELTEIRQFIIKKSVAFMKKYSSD